MLKINKILIAIIALIVSNTGFADTENWYQINLIVFEHISSQALGSELWPQIANIPNVRQAVTPQLLPQAQSNLSLEARRLNNARNYKILTNLSWKQYLPYSNQSQHIRISGERNIGGINQIDGTLTISKTHYFNVKLNLALNEPKEYLDTIGEGNYAPAIANNPIISFQMLQERRTKSEELNYFDHPLFGAILKISKIQSS